MDVLEGKAIGIVYIADDIRGEVGIGGIELIHTDFNPVCARGAPAEVLKRLMYDKLDVQVWREGDDLPGCTGKHHRQSSERPICDVEIIESVVWHQMDPTPQFFVHVVLNGTGSFELESY